MSDREQRRTEGAAWAVALLGMIAGVSVLFTGHGMAALYIMVGALVWACWIYYR